MLWLNVDFVLHIIGEKYVAGKWVILFKSLSGVVTMATGLNGIIVTSSKYYRYQSLFVSILLIAVVISNVMFIPLWGITGAAVASLSSTILFNFARIIFIYVKFKMLPFNINFLIIVAAILITLLIGNILQDISNVVLRTILICISIFVVYLGPIIFLKLSEDINRALSNTYKMTRTWLRK